MQDILVGERDRTTAIIVGTRLADLTPTDLIVAVRNDEMGFAVRAAEEVDDGGDTDDFF